MTPEDFLRRTHASAQEAKPVDRGLMGVILVLVPAGWWLIASGRLESMGAWMLLGLLAGFFGFLGLTGFLHSRSIRRIRRRHGLCCPQCGSLLHGKAALAALALGTCDKCSARVIDAPPAHVTPMESDPFVPELLNRREFHARLKRESEAVSFLHLGGQFLFIIPSISLTNLWNAHRIPTSTYATAMALVGTLFVLLLRFLERKRRARFVQLGLCCPRCHEPLLEAAALTGLGTGRCIRCHAGIFEPGPA